MSAPIARSIRSVWSRLGPTSSISLSAASAERGEDQRTLQLPAGDGHLPTKRQQPTGPTGNADRRILARHAAVAPTGQRAHLRQRLQHAIHRTPAQRLVAVERRRERQRRADPREQTHRRTAVAAIEQVGRRLEAVEPRAAHDQRVAVALELNTPTLQTGDRAAAVGAFEQILDPRIAPRQRIADQRAMRDRLVAGHSQRAAQRADRAEAQRVRRERSHQRRARPWRSRSSCRLLISRTRS